MFASGRMANPATPVTPANLPAAANSTAIQVHAGLVKAAAPAVPAKHFGFRELLSDLNPLQYIPVIGTLFRAITGEVAPEPMRDAASVVVSTVITGPIGAAIDIGEMAVEKITGINPEKIADRMLADIGIGHKPAPAATNDAVRVEISQTSARPVESNKTAAPVAWSHAQLAAYGVTASATGELQQGELNGSDVLNSLELDQINAEHAAMRYAAAAPNTG